MENSINESFKCERKEIYNHKQTQHGVKLKSLANFTQEKEYKILEEKAVKGCNLGMIYNVEDDAGNIQHVSDLYFRQTEPVLMHDGEKYSPCELGEALDIKTVQERLENYNYPNCKLSDEQRSEIKKDFKNCASVDKMPTPEMGYIPQPTVKGLKEEYNNNIDLNKLAGTWKDNKECKRQARPIGDIRQVKSSIEIELDILREGCLDMVDRIDSISTAIEAVRKFA